MHGDVFKIRLGVKPHNNNFSLKSSINKALEYKINLVNLYALLSVS